MRPTSTICIVLCLSCYGYFMSAAAGNQMAEMSSSEIIPKMIDEIGKGLLLQIGGVQMVWTPVRRFVIIPLLRAGLVISLIMSIMLFAELVYMGVVNLFVKLLRRRPEKRYKCEAIEGDPELGSSAYPMVLVQIPMYNEREVYRLSIGAACRISWPSDRLTIQVLDDSTDPHIKESVKMECRQWEGNGIDIRYEIRDNRNGYKSGALKEGLKHNYAKQCDYVVIFDADFQPAPDFLRRAIPFLHHNPDIALVQARWRFVNGDECLMTRLQEMSLNYHFQVEQEVGSYLHSFFGFNGTAGIWRIAAIDEAGGWKDRTTVEDMDLSVRASLRGWKFVFINDLQVNSELPSTLKALKYQQHRWSCGPANLFRKMAMEIIRNEKVSAYKKFHMIYSFFLVKKVIAHIVTFFFYCVVMPSTVFFPEIEVPKWGYIYLPSLITILNLIETPGSMHLVVFWIVFENVMAMHRTKGTLIGLLEAGRVNEWVVTQKLGDAFKLKSDDKKDKEITHVRIIDRIHLLELGVGAYIFVCACYDLSFGKHNLYIYLYMQAISFFVVGFGYVGTFVPTPVYQ